MKRKNKTTTKHNLQTFNIISITYDYASPSYTVIMCAGNILPNEVRYAVDILLHTCRILVITFVVIKNNKKMIAD